MKLIKFVNKEKKSSYFMLETDVNGKSVLILVNFPKGRNQALINYVCEVRFVNSAKPASADSSEVA